MNLAERFPSLDPIKLRTYPAYEVINLFARLVVFNERENKNNDSDIVQINRRPAGDDWF